MVHFEIGDVAGVILQALDDQKFDFGIGPQVVFTRSSHRFDQRNSAFTQGFQHDAAGTTQFVPGEGTHDQRHAAGQGSQVARSQQGGLGGGGVAAAD